MSIEHRPPHAPALEGEHARELLRQMLLIRRFEERTEALYAEGKIRGFLHLYIGEEAVAVGAMQSLTAEDAIVATYREHGHALARGVPAGAVMAEMYGKANGCSRGRGGSMHMFDASRRFYGGHAIVAGGIPFAVGLALADKLQDRRRVTACFFGEGAMAEGEFHESMNLAALWRLPVLFLCENNLYAISTPLPVQQSERELYLKAHAYRIPSEAVDGMDVYAVETAIARAAAAVRRGDGPYFLELRTYRFRGHSMGDPQRYRAKEEIADWEKRGPIVQFVDRLRRDGLLDDATLAAIERDVGEEVAWAVEEAERGPWEPVEDLAKDVYSPADG